MGYQKKTITPEEAYLKIADYCARQDRARLDVLRKLYEYGINPDEAKKIISKLETENYLNQERFARQFVSGKFNIKKWGKRKISAHMKGKGVENTTIEENLSQIPEEKYITTLKALLEKKKPKIKEENPIRLMKKLTAFAVGKGYEPELVIKLVKELVNARWEEDFEPDPDGI